MDKETNMTEAEVRKEFSELYHGPERLSSAGAGAPTGCADAERQAPGEAEGRSRESSAVAPGEAEAAILRAIEWNAKAAGHHHLEASLAVAQHQHAHARFHKSRELQHREDADMLGMLLPQPDSEAPQERSGRRNAEVTDAKRSDH